jgi:hypothetical protein
MLDVNNKDFNVKDVSGIPQASIIEQKYGSSWLVTEYWTSDNKHVVFTRDVATGAITGMIMQNLQSDKIATGSFATDSNGKSYMILTYEPLYIQNNVKTAYFALDNATGNYSVKYMEKDSAEKVTAIYTVNGIYEYTYTNGAVSQIIQKNSAGVEIRRSTSVSDPMIIDGKYVIEVTYSDGIERFINDKNDGTGSYSNLYMERYPNTPEGLPGNIKYRYTSDGNKIEYKYVNGVFTGVDIFKVTGSGTIEDPYVDVKIGSSSFETISGQQLMKIEYTDGRVNKYEYYAITKVDRITTTDGQGVQTTTAGIDDYSQLRMKQDVNNRITEVYVLKEGSLTEAIKYEYTYTTSGTPAVTTLTGVVVKDKDGKQISTYLDGTGANFGHKVLTIYNAPDSDLVLAGYQGTKSLEIIYPVTAGDLAVVNAYEGGIQTKKYYVETNADGSLKLDSSNYYVAYKIEEYNNDGTPKKLTVYQPSITTINGSTTTIVKTGIEYTAFSGNDINKPTNGTITTTTKIGQADATVVTNNIIIEYPATAGGLATVTIRSGGTVGSGTLINIYKVYTYGAIGSGSPYITDATHPAGTLVLDVNKNYVANSIQSYDEDGDLVNTTLYVLVDATVNRYEYTYIKGTSEISSIRIFDGASNTAKQIGQYNYAKNSNKMLFGDNYPRFCLDKKGFVRWIQIINPTIIDQSLRASFLIYQELIFDYLYGAAEEQQTIARLNLQLQELRSEYSLIGSEIRITQRNLFDALNRRYQYCLPQERPHKIT